MNEIREGVRRFQANVQPKMADQFAELANGQSPHTLFVACSDSRVDPSLITQTAPGEIFVLRNAGNLVPVHGEDHGSAAAVEYAVAALKVPNIVVCGHSGCGAMGGLMAPEGLGALPTVAEWVEQAAPTREAAEDVPDAIRHNAAHQLENLMTHPSVRQALQEGRLRLEAWVYDIASGGVEVVGTRTSL